MLMRTTCGSCRTVLELDASLAGTTVECPQCRNSVEVPSAKVIPGVTIGGFHVERLLGKGGMGAVYLAKQVTMDRLVALKILPPSVAPDEDDTARFINEIRMLAKLEHANIVTAFDAGTDAGISYLAMTYVDGETVMERLKSDGALSEIEALAVVYKVASALDYAWNRHQLIHRDIKPSNIMLDSSGEVRLTDLGLCKSLATEGMTMTGTLMGTPNYMSPEQAEGAPVDFRTDIYGLGATLYHMVSGQAPFNASSVMETLRKQVTEPLPDPRTLNPAVTENMVELLMAMMAEKATDRYPTWEACIADVERVMDGKHPLHGALDPNASVVQRLGAAPAAHTPTGKKKVVVRHDSMRQSQPLPLKSSAPADPVPAAPEKPESKWPAFAAGAGVIAVLGVAFGLLAMGRGRQSPAPQRPPTQPVAITPVSLTAQPAESNAAGVSKTQDIRLASLNEQYDRALAFARQNPTAHAEAIAKFDTLRRSAAGTEVEEKADREIKRLQESQRLAIDAAFATLKAGADAMAAKDPASAMAMVENYSGPFALETQSRRKELAALYRSRAEAKQEAVGQNVQKIETCTVRYGEAQEAALASLRQCDWAKAGEAWRRAADEIGGVAAGLSGPSADAVNKLHNQCRGWVADIELLKRLDKAGEAEYRKSLVGKRMSNRGIQGTVKEVLADRLIVQAGAATFEMPVPPCEVKQRLAHCLRAPAGKEDQLRGRFLAAYLSDQTDPAKDAFAQLQTAAMDVTRYEPVMVVLDTQAILASAEQTQKQVDALLARAEKLVQTKSESAFVAIAKQLSDLYGTTVAYSNAIPQIEAMRNRLVTGKLKAGDVKTIDLGNGVTFDMVWIPPGKFIMGSPESEAGRDKGEIQHHVTLTKGFWMGKYEVTQELWEKVMGKNPSQFKGAKNPVEQVSWNDCREFLVLLNDRVAGDGLGRRSLGEGGFRLPTEAEWEYACRAGTTGETYFDILNLIAWHPGNGEGTTHPVGKKRANAWGLHDMIGNVWEWCQDWYVAYPSEAVSDPTGPGSGVDRVIRGGGWFHYAWDCRSARRDGRDTRGHRGGYLGFRLARD